MSWVRPALALALAATGAVACAVKPTDAAQSGNHRPQATTTALLDRGESYYKIEQYDSAKVAWSRALEMSTSSKDERNQARALTSLGLVSGRLGNQDDAERFGEKALAMKMRLGMTTELSASYHSLGLAALDADSNQKAQRLFSSALQFAQRSHDKRGIAKAYGGLGLTYAYLNDFARARERQRAARIAALEAGDVRLQANALANMAMNDVWQGNPLPAIAEIDTARNLYHSSHYAAGEQNALGQLGTAYELTGREDLALAAFDSSLAITRRLGLREQEAEMLRLIAGVHMALGDYRQALSTYSRADSLMRAGHLDANLASVKRGIAEADLRLGNIPAARAMAGDALNRHTISKEPLERLDDILLQSEIESESGNSSAAEHDVSVARQLSDKIHTRGARAYATLAEARLADKAKDSRRVLNVLHSAESDVLAGDPGLEWLSNAMKARAYSRLGNLDSARACGLRAVKAVDQLRGALASEALRSTYVADRSDVYGDLVITLVRMNRIEEAFAVADRARSRELLERLDGTRADSARREMIPDVAERERLLHRIDQLVERLRSTDRRPSPERGVRGISGLSSTKAELDDARSEYESLVARAAQRNRPATEILGISPVGLHEIRASLDPDETLLEYMLTSDRLITFVATRDTLRFESEPLDASVLLQRVRLLADLWGKNDPNWRLGIPVSRELFKTLIRPVINSGALGHSRRVVIVPHGILGEVPFSALVDESTGRFFMQTYSVSMLPTAGALPALRRRAQSVASSVNGFGFAPFNGDSELPATGLELEAFGNATSRKSLAFGKNATESAVRSALGKLGIVHVATHGVMNLRDPLFSRVELAAGSPGTTANDGRLEVHELLTLPIRSSLVFLSGCETGAGVEWLNDPVRGTADLTLAQVVLSAGAANVVTTLWRIADQGAARFAGRFYQNLHRLPIDDAFAVTQRQMAIDPQYQNPYYWAAYVLSGDGRFSTKPQITSTTSVPVTSAAHVNAVPTDR
jgi:Uncharacterized protein conserved in bacteria